MKKIYKIENYTDKNGRNVTMLIDNNDSNCIEFFGNTIVEFSDAKSPVTFPFNKDINSVETAFDSFEKSITEFIEQNYKEQQKENIDNKSVVDINN